LIEPQTSAALEPATGQCMPAHWSADMPIERPCKWRENSWRTGLWTRVVTFQVHTRLPAAPRQRRSSEKEQKGSCFSTGRLKEHTAAYALTVRFVKTEHVRASFLRHAIFPDVTLFGATQRESGVADSLRTHRWDESDRVLLAGCSPAELLPLLDPLSLPVFYVRLSATHRRSLRS